MVGKVLCLSQREQVGVDPLRLDQLYGQLGESGAEEVICRAMEELALRLTRAERLFRQGDLAELRKGARGLAAIADHGNAAKALDSATAREMMRSFMAAFPSYNRAVRGSIPLRSQRRSTRKPL